MLMMKMKNWKLYIVVLIAVVGCTSYQENNRIFYASQVGAKADGKTVNTKTFQAILDKIEQNGGGKLIIDAPGTYLTGTISLKSHTTLEVQAGAVLLGSPNIEDYDSLTGT